MTLTASKAGASGTANLAEETFGQDWNEHLVWHVVRNEMLWRRQGTHSTLTRGQVKGGSAKPWRQKGTGRARQGTTRAPQWAGGGVVFGPTPRSYGGKVNRKERAAAMRAALSMHASRGSLIVLAETFADKPSTKTAMNIRSGLSYPGAAGKLTVVCTWDEKNVWKSFRNIDTVQVVAAHDLDVADVMWGRGLMVTEAALAVLEGRGA
jgi:large subunit ribosomal protein L4